MTNPLEMLWHYILIFVLMIERLLRGTKIKIVNKEQMHIVSGVKGPIIFAPTHCGKIKEYNKEIINQQIKITYKVKVKRKRRPKLCQQKRK